MIREPSTLIREPRLQLVSPKRPPRLESGHGPLVLPGRGLTATAVATATKPRFFLGWTVVAVAVLASFTEVAFFNPVLGVFIPEFEREFGWSRTEISLGVSLGSLVGAAVAPFFGPMVDRYGGRPFVVGGAAFMAIGLVAHVPDADGVAVLHHLRPRAGARRRD